MLAFKQFLIETDWWEDPEHVWFMDKDMSKFLDRNQIGQMYTAQALKDKEDREKNREQKIKQGEIDPNDPNTTQIWQNPLAQQAQTQQTRDNQQDTQIYTQGLQQKVGELEKRLRDLEQSSHISDLQKKVVELEKLFQTAKDNVGNTVDKFRSVNPPKEIAA